MPKYILSILVLLFSLPSFSQLKGLGAKILEKTASVASSGSILDKPDPITTSFKDVDHTNQKGPEEIAASFPAQPNIGTLQRTPNGGYLLKEGSYYYQAQSYCLKAGTQGPSKGFGYMYAVTKGLAEDQVMSIIRNSVQHPEIAQREIQLLLWAIIAHAKFEDLQPRVKATATKLLTPAQLAQLNRSAIDLVPERILNKAKASVPKEVRLILDAEQQLRRMLTTAGSSYEEMERVAVLAADAVTGNEETQPGTWTWHPEGYYIRFFPTDYYSTKVEIHIPKGSTSIGKEFDPATHIAAPALTGRQRLIMSARYYYDNNTGPIPQFPDPAIFELVPSRGNPGDMIKIEGDNFRSESKIYFGNIETDYIRSMNKTEIYVRVPPHAITAPVKVISPTSECVSAINFTVPPIIMTGAITTSLPDAKWMWDDPYRRENFEPREAQHSLMELQRTPNGGFVIKPGYFEFAAQSYLIKAGNQVISAGGPGYLYAPPKGPRADIVMTILRNAVNKPNITQSAIQELLTEIIKGTKSENFNTSVRVTASQLLEPRQFGNLVYAYPTTSRDTVTSRDSVLAYPVPANVWSVHPDGYYVQYQPVNATTTIIKIWIPQGSPGVEKEIDLATHIAVPTDVTRERIIFSGRPSNQQ